MRRKGWLLGIGVIACVILGAFLSSRRTQHVSFAGGTLELPWPWRTEAIGSTVATLSIRRADNRQSGYIDLLDERQNPIESAHFVENWKQAARTQHNPPQSVDPYHDAYVDAAGLRCVRLRWSQEFMPMEISCVTGDGRWRIVLMGHDDDIPGLDDLARQMHGFEQGS